MTISRLFARQLKTVFPDRGASTDDEIGDVVEKILTGPEPEVLLQKLFAKVESSYAKYDRDLKLSSASLKLSFAELEDSNARLQQKTQIQQELIDSLRSSIEALLQSAGRKAQVEALQVKQLPDLFAQLLKENQQARRALEFQKYALDQHAIVSTTDSQGRITYANRKFCEISGFEEKELLGKTHRMVKSGEHDHDFYQHMWSTISSGQVWHGELKNRTKSGGYYWVSASIVPILNDQGFPEQYISIRTDISERKAVELKLRKEQHFLGKLADTLGEGVYALDGQGRCIFMNQMAESLLGWSREELSGQVLHDIIHYRTPEGVPIPMASCPISQCISKGGQYFSDSEYFIRKDGRSLPVEVASVPLEIEGEQPGSVAAFKDITQRKLDQQAKQEALERAETATRAKSEFLANMSHEIRTPMNAIIGLSHLMKGTELDKSQGNYLSKIESSAHNLLGIIDDILDFSKIEAGKLDIDDTPFELDELLRSIYDVNGIRAHEKGLSLSISRDFAIPARLSGDSTRIKQILTNLLSNAIKFTHHGQVTVEVAIVSRTGDEIALEFCVADSGIGIDKRYLDSLFQAFTQADASITRQYGGTGLGLTITHQLTELLGGTIQVESELNRGTSFRVTLPLKAIDTDMTRQHILQGVDLLQIGEEPQLARFLDEAGINRQLQPYGRDVIAQLSVQLQENIPDCVLLIDQQQPDSLSDFLTLLGQQCPALKAVPVVIYSAPDVFEQARSINTPFTLYGCYELCTPSALINCLHEALHPHVTALGQQQLMLDDEEHSQLRGISVLLAEDNSINAEVAKGLLAKMGVQTTAVADGQAALACLCTQPFDLVLMDLQMPILDGLATTREIRKDERFAELPIIALTAHAMSGDFERSLSAGMNDHITKPIDPVALKTVLLKWTKTGQSTVRLRVQQEESKDKVTAISKDTSGILPGLEWQAALDRVAGDMSFYLSLWDMYESNFSDLPSRFRDTCEQHDAHSIKQFAHSVKGVAANLGATELMAVAREIEQAEVTPPALMAAYLNRLAEVEARLQDSVQALRHMNDEKREPSAPDQPGIEHLFERLEALLRHGDTAVLDFVSTLEEQSQATETGRRCRKLAALISDFEFDEALRLLSH